MNNDVFDSDPFDSEDKGEHYGSEEFSSKTQLKLASEELKKLGLELVGLTKGELQKTPLDDELKHALEVAAKINRKKEGFRRQIQLIGKLLRQRDVAPIKLALDKLRNDHTHTVKIFHELEKARDEMIREGNDGVQAVMEKHPQLDRQKLRQLVRTAAKEAKENKPPAASRELFKYLKAELVRQ
ncbi:ribosome biogenesis factor YjgA [Glaciecola sp. SC05]|uniref:ribosome biogenesis factor YjgA n=1 Tax=Glaciecola sp. SC05 TaxID=1987355 RepID=UPI003526D4A1